MRKPIIIANWKMYKTRAEASAFCRAFLPLIDGQDSVDAVICAPFTQLDVLAAELAGSKVGVGAQNFYPAAEGAFTGEVSLPMLQEIGVQYVIIGHSERREIFCEDGPMIQQKVQAAYAAGVQPILCVGEHLEQRNNGLTVSVCSGQMLSAVEGLTEEQMKTLIVAYEPIWAIGTGKTATAADAEEVIGALRQAVAGKYGLEVADCVRFQYGGSVKPENIAELMAQPDIDGALVGGASLEPESFSQLILYKY
ncbi:MAG: triose-phosphate isomerase [Peptococcaceae bacterium]|nr:triose-phosphate isomerase [Peptococcaceae bacterium]